MTENPQIKDWSEALSRLKLASAEAEDLRNDIIQELDPDVLERIEPSEAGACLKMLAWRTLQTEILPSEVIRVLLFLGRDHVPKSELNELAVVMDAINRRLESLRREEEAYVPKPGTTTYHQ
jgi:hypothetical protein